MTGRGNAPILPSEYASIGTLVLLSVWSMSRAANADSSPWLAVDIALAVALAVAANWYWHWLHRPERD